MALSKTMQRNSIETVEWGRLSPFNEISTRTVGRVNLGTQNLCSSPSVVRSKIHVYSISGRCLDYVILRLALRQ